MPQLIPTAAPALPLPLDQYDREAQQQLHRALRQYFRQIDSTMQQLLLGFNNYGTFSSTVTQNVAAALPSTTVSLVTFNTTVEAFGISIDPVVTSRVLVSKAGVYNFQFSAQLDHTTGSRVDFYIWFRRNGIDIPNSATKIVVLSGSDETVAAWNYLITMEARDYFELAWAADGASARLLAVAASAPVPAIPSVILTATYVYPDAAGL